MPAASPLQSIVVFSRSAPQICGPAVYVGRLPSLSAKAAPLWPKRLSCQSGHPIVGPRRRGGCLKSAYVSQATEQDDATTELTVAGGTEGSNPLRSTSESVANLTSSSEFRPDQCPALQQGIVLPGVATMKPAVMTLSAGSPCGLKLTPLSGPTSAAFGSQFHRYRPISDPLSACCQAWKKA